ncbi:hypothetical protein [Tsukamurella soli]|uniref:hypothetical protein n=1 Tax=Tsukamurella soli TaxID=644556 RepID=UPI0036186AB0
MRSACRRNVSTGGGSAAGRLLDARPVTTEQRTSHAGQRAPRHDPHDRGLTADLPHRRRGEAPVPAGMCVPGAGLQVLCRRCRARRGLGERGQDRPAVQRCDGAARSRVERADQAELAAGADQRRPPPQVQPDLRQVRPPGRRARREPGVDGGGRCDHGLLVDVPVAEQVRAGQQLQQQAGPGLVDPGGLRDPALFPHAEAARAHRGRGRPAEHLQHVLRVS